MPIYEYRCSDCGISKDHLQKVSEPLIDTCPACGSKAYNKALSAAGFQLKGSGWYATDFKGSSSAPAATKTEDKPAADGGASTPSASTPAATATGGSCNPGCACH